jgi:hypothetical protein
MASERVQQSRKFGNDWPSNSSDVGLYFISTSQTNKMKKDRTSQKSKDLNSRKCDNKNKIIGINWIER